jgi:hypothetical protein
MLSFIALDTVGKGVHRSGWPYALRSLERHFRKSSRQLLLDDYIERTFLFRRNEHLGTRHTTPWVGICHHPPDLPNWYDHRGLQSLAKNPRWRASFPFLRLVVTFAENSTRWIAENWRKPCVTLRHPTAVPELKWSLRKYQLNANKRLLQVGSFLRNTHAIYQVQAPLIFRKTRLVQSADWIASAHDKSALLFGHRPYVGNVEELGRLKNEEFDRLLSANIVFIELISAVANNTIIECIARNTPIVVNRLPGPEYYLGKEYPLFYNDIGEVHSLLTEENIVAASRYLKSLDKSWISGRAFAAAFESACELLLPEFNTVSLPSPSSIISRN